MECPNCKQNTTVGGICPHCGVDVILYKKTIHVSATLYNKGLARAKRGELSGAMDALIKSVEFNKKNINAHNLLGLVYFGLGRVGDALKHWVISMSFQKENNPAATYVDGAQKNSRMLEKYTDSIKMYNQALLYLHQKSEDMAIIQLKKAVELIPSFVDALNLLALCYLMQKDKEKAAVCAEKVLQTDASNAIALNYYRDIYPDKNQLEAQKKESRPIQRKPERTAYAISAKPVKKSGVFPVAGIICFLVGCACMAAVFYILVMPEALEARDVIISQNKLEADEKVAALAKLNLEGIEQISGLESEIAAHSKKNEQLAEQLDRQERINKVFSINNMVRNGKNEDAGDALFVMNVSGLPVDVVELYESLKLEVYPKVAASYYSTGVSAYGRKEYEEAKTIMEKAWQYVSPTANNADDIMYYRGLVAEVLEEPDEAKKFYQKLMDTYPNSNVFYNARNRLQRMQ